MRTGASDLSMRECRRNPLRTFLHTLDLRHRQGHHAVTDGIIRQRQGTLLGVSPRNQPPGLSHVDWHSAIGLPRASYVADDV